MAKLVQLSFLAPDIVQAILQGQQPATLTQAKLLETELLPAWPEQRILLQLANGNACGG